MVGLNILFYNWYLTLVYTKKYHYFQTSTLALFKREFIS